MAEKENDLENQGLKTNASPVFFISMVGVDKYGIIDEVEYIFDLYTKLYDFHGSDVHVITAQDLWTFYESKTMDADRKNVDIYFLVEFFVHHHPDGNFILDECPFIRVEGKQRKPQNSN